MGNTSPGNVNGRGVTLATAPATNGAEGDKVNWNVGLHVDQGNVTMGGIANGYTFSKESDALKITTPSGNVVKILDGGDIEAFA
jgi:hypothetical protein